MIITIDGPSGSGKTTIAQKIALSLGFSYLDTGALYRSLAYTFLSQNIDILDEKAVARALSSLSCHVEHETTRYIVNSVDTTDYLRTQEVANASSIISSYRSIRAFLLPIQREFAHNRSTVCEGRDMGTTIFPNADIKIFLTAHSHIRARRRFLELQPSDISLCDLEKEIKERDERDSKREISPLVKPENAIVIDTTELSISDVVHKILLLTK